jgi:hypothetical protein
MKSVVLIKSKRVRLFLLVAAFGVIMFLATFLDGAYENLHFSGKANLTIEQEITLPLREISGVYLHRTSRDEKGGELFAIGDNVARLGIAHFDGHTLQEPRFLDFTSPLVQRFAPCQSAQVLECGKIVKDLTSQWEAVAVDGAGKIFLLHERYASIFVLDKKAEHLEATINLASFTPQHASPRGRVAIDKDNALGEGFILLNNGHLLVIKERFPPSLVEFGAPGSQAKGFSPEMVLKPEEEFIVAPGTQTLEPLHVWNLEDRFRHCDLSELVASNEGVLHVLSQQCRWIGRLDTLSLENQIAVIAQQWHLPAKLGFAESLAIIDKDTFLVGEDKRSQRNPNLFVLRKLPLDVKGGNSPTASIPSPQ